MDERRENQRFKLDQTCVIQHERTVGTIVDISVGGLSCVCLDQGDCSKGLSTQVNIYCKKNDICAEEINMKVLSTESMPGQFIENLGLRKCRAKFCGIDAPQKSQLASIIVNSTMAAV